ncbi:MAG: cupin domain-containing protein [Okeania sp. SIO2H7]|nr:cupin domain-containing protein [Okeania sp. SIO2H7]
MTKEEIIQKLNLVEHIEGGYFSETYRSLDKMPVDRVGKERNVMTSIFYLLTSDRPTDFFHKNISDVVHYFHWGSPLTYMIIHPDGKFEKIKLGMDINAGEVPQLTVKGGCWKAATLLNGEYGLLGEAVAPGFDYRDMQIADETLLDEFPHLKDEIQDYIQK